jgi:hypothetical protein
LLYDSLWPAGDWCCIDVLYLDPCWYDSSEGDKSDSKLPCSKNPSQISPHQTLPSLLPLNMQNYQSTGQHHPMILNHLLTQMEEAGYSSLTRPTSVPAEESVSYQPQLRPRYIWRFICRAVTCRFFSIRPCIRLPCSRLHNNFRIVRRWFFVINANYY